jgi:hypothetical protein
MAPEDPRALHRDDKADFGCPVVTGALRSRPDHRDHPTPEDLMADEADRSIPLGVVTLEAGDGEDDAAHRPRCIDRKLERIRRTRLGARETGP